MPGALAAIEGRGGEIRIEEDQRLGRHPAILDEAEAQRVDPRAPGEVRRRAAEPRHRIGETRPVHVEAETTRLAEPAQRRDFLRSEEHTSELQSLMSISYAVF